MYELSMYGIKQDVATDIVYVKNNEVLLIFYASSFDSSVKWTDYQKNKLTSVDKE